MPTEKQTMQGCTVLIPRPAGTADSLVQLLERHGCQGICFPVIEFLKTHKTDQLDATLIALDKYDIAVFVSVPAVNFVLSRLVLLNKKFPQTVQVAVMGNKTAQTCQAQDINVDFVPESESGTKGLLLCLGNESLENKKIVIFRGQNGMDALRKTLQAQGAIVDYVECYRRAVSAHPLTSILDKWHKAEIDTVLISSVSILQALLSRLGPQHRFLLETTPVIAFSQRIAERCQLENIQDTIVVAGLDDMDILQAVQKTVS